MLVHSKPHCAHREAFSSWNSNWGNFNAREDGAEMRNLVISIILHSFVYTLNKITQYEKMQINVTRAKLREKKLGCLEIEWLLSLLLYLVAGYNVYFNINRTYSLNKRTPLSVCSSESHSQMSFSSSR